MSALLLTSCSRWTTLCLVASLLTIGIGCSSNQGTSAQEAKAATDPPYARGTYGTPSDPAWPYDAPYHAGGGGRR